jgi:hypothetical protein
VFSKNQDLRMLNSLFSHPIEVLIAAAAAWVFGLELRLRNTQSRLIKMEGKVKDDAISEKVRAMGPHDLDTDLAKRIEQGRSEKP